MTLRRLVLLGKAVFVCGLDQVESIKRDLRNEAAEVIGEPMGRNTAPAVGLVLAGGNIPEDEVIGVFPADHYIEDDVEFHQVVGQAIDLSRKEFLVTIGIIPDRPETGYGYIERGFSLGGQAYRVKAFHEKPDPFTAARYVASKGFYWNAGIFIATAATWTRLFQQHLPELFRFISLGQEAYLEAYAGFPDVSIDYGIAEKCGKMAVVEGNFGWNDVGSWSALANVLPLDEQGNALTGKVVAVESTNCLGRSEGRSIVLFGVDNLVVVESGDYILVCPKQKSQDIKGLLARLETK